MNPSDELFNADDFPFYQYGFQAGDDIAAHQEAYLRSKLTSEQFAYIANLIEVGHETTAY